MRRQRVGCSRWAGPGRRRVCGKLIYRSAGVRHVGTSENSDEVMATIFFPVNPNAPGQRSNGDSAVETVNILQPHGATLHRMGSLLGPPL
jgi:hypothetical protein